MALITGSGRKRKLSNYRSKRDIKRRTTLRKAKFTDDIEPNYQKLVNESNESDIDVLHADSSEDMSTAESEHMETLSSIDGDNSNDISKDVEEGSISMESNSERVDFRQECIEELCSIETAVLVIEKMEEAGNLHDFMNLIRLLASGELPADNIVLLLLFDRVRFQKCKSTVGMRYRDKTKLFWSIVYRLCKGVGLRFFSGEKNWGQVVNNTSEKSKYIPHKSKINFAVPDEKVLRKLSHQKLPKIIPPGIIKTTLDMLNNKDDLILMADGKLVTKGLKSEFVGDVDLFGHENAPNLTELRNYLDKQIDYVCNSMRHFKTLNNEDRVTNIMELVENLNDLTMKVRMFYKDEKNRLQKLLTGNYPSKPDKAVSTCKTNIYTSCIWIRKALNINLKLLRFLSQLQHNMHLFNSANSIEISQCRNLRLLHEPMYVLQSIDRNDFPHLIKKYSDEWIEMLKESLVTDDTLGDSLGLNGMQQMKRHYKQFIQDNYEEDYFSRVNYKQYEIDAMTTLCSILTPAYLPSCAVMYEEGISFLPGQRHATLLSSSPCAVIRY